MLKNTSFLKIDYNIIIDYIVRSLDLSSVDKIRCMNCTSAKVEFQYFKLTLEFDL